MSYEALRDVQVKLQNELQFLFDQGEQLVLASPQQCAVQKQKLETVKNNFVATDGKLKALLTHIPDLAQRGYF